MSKYIKASGMIEVIEMLRWSNYLDKNSTLNLLVRAIEQSPTDTVDAIEVPTWIPVTERLPEKRGMVLASYCGAVSVVWFFAEDQWEFPSGFVATNGVTHWMPLPTPPKDGET